MHAHGWLVAAAPFGSPYRDRFSSTCEACFEAHAVCTHYPVHRLRLLLVGHNPSIHAWGSGFPYSNPTNNMRTSQHQFTLHDLRWARSLTQPNLLTQ